MITKRSQTAVEYLIIMALVIVIALVVIVVIGGFPGIGSGTSKKVSDFQLSTNENIGIEKYAFTNGSVLAVVKNNNFETLIVENLVINGANCNSGNTLLSGTSSVGVPVTLNPGQSVTINCSNSSFVPSLNDGATPPVTITYTNPSLGSNYTISIGGTRNITVGGGGNFGNETGGNETGGGNTTNTCTSPDPTNIDCWSTEGHWKSWGPQPGGAAYTVTGATSLTDGMWNTQKIMTMPNSTNYLAAAYCANLTEGNHTAGSWYLPSKNELLSGVTALGNTTFSGLGYWSSTEIDQFHAWELYTPFGPNPNDMIVSDWKDYGTPVDGYDYIARCLLNGS